MAPTADLELSLRRDGDAYAVELRFVPAGSSAPARLLAGAPAAAPIDEAALVALDAAALEPERYGELLTGLLFADPRLVDALARARAAAESAGAALRLRLALDERDPALHRLRWELLRDPGRPERNPLAADERLLLSRFLSSDDLLPVRPQTRAELSAVVAVANPAGLASFQLTPIDVFAEVEHAEAALADIPTTFLSQAHGRPATLAAVADVLRDDAAILYLMCHGTLLGDTSYLWLENDAGKIARVTGAEFAAQIRALARRPLLAVLASCRSAGDAAGNTLAAVGPLLVAAGVPAVVAVQDDVAMTTVAAFLPALFRELRRDGRIDRAVAAARAALGTSDGWWQPVLWMRLADGRLWADEETPAPNQPAPPTHNLPAFPTPLLGRAGEVTAICELIRRAEARLVTVLGPGGVGKTRLAAQAAWELLDDFPDGARFVNLTEVTSMPLLASAITEALGVQESGGGPLERQIGAFLRERRMLLVLDNFEQIVDAAPLVARILAAAPRVEVICTSRAPLRILGEHELPVAPLPTPDTQALPRRKTARLEAIAASPAVALFVARAQAVRPAFALSAENAEAVAEICRQVDGLPLAIELAAARSKLLTPQNILARLTSRLALLTGGARELAAHQQTLRGTIAWSYDMLSQGEQGLLARLAIFAGGCTLAAAEEICAPGPELGLDLLDGISSLVDKSLLRQGEQPDGEPRFSLLATIREYALEQLVARGEVAELERRHATYYAAVAAAAAAAALLGPEQPRALDELSREHDNLRAALAWMERNDGELLAATCSALWRFWYLRSHFDEGRRRLATALAGAVEQENLVFANLLSGAASLAWAQGDHGQAAELYERSLALRRRLDDGDGVARTLNNLGNVAMRRGEYAQAAERYNEATALFRQQGGHGAMVETLHNLGLATLYLGEPQPARAAFAEALARARAAGNSRTAAYALNNLGLALLGEGVDAEARASFEESLALQRELGSREGAAASLNNLGHVALRQGSPAEAESHFAESLALRQELGDRVGVAACLEGFACLAAALGEPRRAAQLAGAAAALRTSLGAPIAPHEQAISAPGMDTVRAALGEPDYAAALAEGARLSDATIGELLMSRHDAG